MELFSTKKEIKDVSALVVSCCVFMTPKNMHHKHGNIPEFFNRLANLVFHLK